MGGPNPLDGSADGRGVGIGMALGALPVVLRPLRLPEEERPSFACVRMQWRSAAHKGVTESACLFEPCMSNQFMMLCNCSSNKQTLSCINTFNHCDASGRYFRFVSQTDATWRHIDKSGQLR